MTYETAPGFCMGRCPTFRFSVNSNGKGLLRQFYGTGHLMGMRPFHVSGQRFAAFERSIARFRPKGQRIWYDGPECKSLMSDQGEIHITWSDRLASDTLMFNLGCDVGDGNTMWNALHDAPMLLGLKNLPDVATGSLASTRIR